MHQGLQKTSKNTFSIQQKARVSSAFYRIENRKIGVSISFRAWFGIGYSARYFSGDIFLAHGDYYLPTRLLGGGRGGGINSKMR